MASCLGFWIVGWQKALIERHNHGTMDGPTNRRPTGWRLPCLPGSLDSHHLRLPAPDAQINGHDPPSFSFARYLGPTVSGVRTRCSVHRDRESRLVGQRGLLFRLIVKTEPGDF